MIKTNLLGQPVCKFCDIPEGLPSWNGKPAHINRDGLCAACYTLLEKEKSGPDKVPPRDHQWFVDMCEANMRRGGFVPVAWRGRLQHLKPWQCKRCGQANKLNRDSNYKCYCMSCASEVRCSRDLPTKGARKTRSDKGKMHRVGSVAVHTKRGL